MLQRNTSCKDGKQYGLILCFDNGFKLMRHMDCYLAKKSSVIFFDWYTRWKKISMLEVIEVSGFYAAGSNKLEYIFKHMKQLIQD